MFWITISRLFVGVAVFACTAAAQSFNLDFGAGTPVPASSYGAAAGQPGTWTTNTGNVTTALVDIQGSATPVVLTLASQAPDADWISSPAYTGDAAALMNDWIGANDQAGSIPARLDLTFTNLASGDYEVYTYGHLANLDCRATVVVVGSPDPTTSTTGPANAELPLIATHTRHRVHVDSGTISVMVSGPQVCEPFTRVAVVNGMQIVRLDGSGHPLCVGDGSLAACPCGNAGGVGRGCANSFDATGAQLVAVGTAAVSADSLVLSANGVSNSVVTFFQGMQPMQGGAGIAFGDGLRCAGGTNVRLVSRPATSGQVSYPLPGDVPISTRGFLDAFGGVRVYQVWYRDSAAFCSAATFNATNGVRVAWLP